MPAARYAKSGKKIKGPTGTASQRATKQGKIKGRATSASTKVSNSKKLPNSQGT